MQHGVVEVEDDDQLLLAQQMLHLMLTLLLQVVLRNFQAQITQVDFAVTCTSVIQHWTIC